MTSKKRKSPRQKRLTNLVAAYSLCVSENEDYIWEAYGQKLKEAVLGLVRYNIEPNPDDLEACRKHEKQIQLAILRLHSEVQELYNET